MSPLVSIIIPCFNVAHLVGEAIDSALAQTWPNKEVIVIDDGSTDGSLDVIRSFGDKVRWETGRNRGGSTARNRGIELARGVFVQFLDADDVLLPSKLEIMVPTAISSRDANSIPVCDWYVEMEGQTPRRHAAGYDGSDPICWCAQHNFQTAAPLHRRSVLTDVGGFRDNLPRCQEFDLHLRLAAQGFGFSYMPVALFRHRRRTGSVSADHSQVLMQHLGIFHDLAATLLTRDMLTPERNRSIALALARAGRLLVRYGHPINATNLFEAARELDPASVPLAFGNRWSRLVSTIAGPENTEKLIQWLVRLPSTLR